MTDLDEWHSHDLLKCHICGEHFAMLGLHITTKHNITTKEYRARFGIHWTYGLTGRATRIKLRTCAARTLAKMRERGMSNLAHARDAKKKKAERIAA